MPADNKTNRIAETAGAVSGISAALAQMFLPNTSMRPLIVGAVAAASVLPLTKKIDRESVVALIVAGAVSYAAQQNSATNAIAVGLLTGAAVALIIDLKAFQVVNSDDDSSPSSSAAAAVAASAGSFPYLDTPSGGWDISDLTDSKRPRGWLVGKNSTVLDYTPCESCE